SGAILSRNGVSGDAAGVCRNAGLGGPEGPRTSVARGIRGVKDDGDFHGRIGGARGKDPLLHVRRLLHTDPSATLIDCGCCRNLEGFRASQGLYQLFTEVTIPIHAPLLSLVLRSIPSPSPSALRWRPGNCDGKPHG